MKFNKINKFVYFEIKGRRNFLLVNKQTRKIKDEKFVKEVRDEVVYVKGLLNAKMSEQEKNKYLVRREKEQRKGIYKIQKREYYTTKIGSVGKGAVRVINIENYGVKYRIREVNIKEMYKIKRRKYYTNFMNRGIVDELIKFIKMTRSKSKLLKTDELQSYKIKSVKEGYLYNKEISKFVENFKNFYTNKIYIKEKNEKIMNDLMFGKRNGNKLDKSQKIELLDNPRYNPLKGKEELMKNNYGAGKNIYLKAEELPEYLKHLIMKLTIGKSIMHPHLKIGEGESFGVYMTTSTVRSQNIETKVILDMKKEGAFLHKTLLPKIDNREVIGGDKSIVGLLYKPEKNSTQYLSNIIKMEKNEKIEGIGERSERVEYIMKTKGINREKAENLFDNFKEEVLVFIEEGEMDSIKVRTERGVIIDVARFEELGSVRNNVVEIVNRVLNSEIISKYELKILFQEVLMLESVLEEGGEIAELLGKTTPELKVIKEKGNAMSKEEKNEIIEFIKNESLIEIPGENMYMIDSDIMKVGGEFPAIEF